MAPANSLRKSAGPLSLKVAKENGNVSIIDSEYETELRTYTLEKVALLSRDVMFLSQ